MIYRQKPQKSRTIKTAPKSKTNMKNFIRGFFFCVLWYLSIIAGFFVLICPVLPLAIISPRRYRRWSDTIFGLWEPFPVAMMEVCFGIRVVLSGDKINPFEGSLFVMNHRTRVDWNFLWLGLFHCCQPNAHNMKYILKAPLMHFPGPGWVMQTCSFIFVHRKWERDRPLLNNIIEYLNESDSLYQILIFPEGTDLTENNIQKSHKYAEENNLEKYSKVLHPRTKGFTFIANKMKSGGQLKAIYDLTIAYPKTPPQNELDLLRGKFPSEVHFNVKRYSSSSIPCDEEKLKTWLTTLWKEKEEKLNRFYATGCFAGEGDGVLYNLSNQDIDFGKMSIKNGVIKYEAEGGDPNSSFKEISVVSVDRRTASGRSVKPSISNPSPVEEEEEPNPVTEETTSANNPPIEEEQSVTEEQKAESSTSNATAGSTRPSGAGSAATPEKAASEEAPAAPGSTRSSRSGSAAAEAGSEEAPAATGSKRSSRSGSAAAAPEKAASEGARAAAGGTEKPPSGTESEIYARNHANCEDVYRTKNYRPSHLLYLVLVFWLTLTFLTIHQLFCNFYLQIWVLTHSVLFTFLSLVSNGFHHVAAAMYFYKYGRKRCPEKKTE